MCRQVSRIESAATWSWTVQVSDPIRTMAVRDAESYRAPLLVLAVCSDAERRPDAALSVDGGDLDREAGEDPLVLVGEPGLGVGGRGGHVVQGDHELLAEGGGEVAAGGAGAAAVGVDADVLVAGDDDAGQDVLPVDAGDELVSFAGHGESPSFLPRRVRLRRGGRAGVWVAGQGLERCRGAGPGGVDLGVPSGVGSAQADRRPGGASLDGPGPPPPQTCRHSDGRPPR